MATHRRRRDEATRAVDVVRNDVGTRTHTAREHRQFVIVSAVDDACADMSELSLEEFIERGVSLCC